MASRAVRVKSFTLSFVNIDSIDQFNKEISKLFTEINEFLETVNFVNATQSPMICLLAVVWTIYYTEKDK